MLTVIGVEILVGLLHNYLHDAFHISGHWLYRVPFVNMWFSHLVSLHYLHHVNMNSNFGIFTFHWDKVFKTFGKDNT
jgi:sterol desaturase/sphingolipid hydroxylase (fatty acid hydroxylase superfamily)